MKFFPAHAVRLTDGPFAAALRTDLDSVLALDGDRLLAPFLREAGLDPVAPSYGNWEDSGLDGHTAGHWLSALAHLHAATGEDEPLARLRAALDELDRAQRAVGTGWLGGVPGGAALFGSLRDGGIDAARAIGSHTHWVPWYNLHKTFQGLIDAHVVAGEERALRMATWLADWWLDIAAGMDDDAFEAMLDTEFGGMNEAYATLARLTGREDYAAMARRFSHRAILDPLLEGADALTGLHANTQIPKAVGYAAIGGELHDAADAFWRTVVTRRSVVIGGNSVREHFHDPGDFTPMIEDREGPETCNTYNMLKLTRELLEAAPRPEMLDYAERALLNHVLSAQHPDGGYVYFTSMRPRHYRVYSTSGLGFWCCVGTGMEMQARVGEWVFGTEGDALAVNLFVPAELDAADFGVRLRLDADLPSDDRVSVRVSGDAPRPFPLRLRVPGWAGRLDDLRVNGAAVTGAVSPGAVTIERAWGDGDEVSFRVPLELRAERLPDGSAWQAYLAGPFALAARDESGDLDGLRADDSRMGHVAAGPLRPLGDVPIVAEGVAGASRTGPASWRVPTGDPAGFIDLEPFAGLHDSRYTIYWPIDGPGRRAQLVAEDERLALDQATLDALAFGEQQPESDHAVAADGSPVWSDGDAHGRHLRSTITATLRDPASAGRRLRLRVLPSAEATAFTLAWPGEARRTVRIAAGQDVVELDVAPAAPAHLELVPMAGVPAPVIRELRLLR